MSNPFSPLILPTGDITGLQSSLLTVIDALNAVTPRLGVVEDILEAAGFGTTRFGAVPMTWLGVWTPAFIYLRGDVVTHAGLLMIANKTTTETPSLSASDWDNLSSGGGGGGVFSYVRAVQVTTPTALSLALTPIQFDGELEDSNNLHDNVVNNERLVPDAAGIWVASGQVTTESDDPEVEFFYLTIVHVVGGSPTDSTEIRYNWVRATAINSRFSAQVTLGDGFRLALGDWLELHAIMRPSGNTRASGNNTWFSMRRVAD